MLANLMLGFLIVAGAQNGASSEVDRTARAALDKLPGESSFVFTELTPDGPVALFGVNADERLAVGSSFKLYVFGRLVAEVNDGRRRLDNTMLLRHDLAGPPQSEMNDWPVGAPVTLSTLALKMISVSDNTATDHLIHLLGRRNIERQMRRMGHGDVSVNRPLLSTREMTMLRDKHRDMPGKEYQSLDEQAKRRFLANLDQGALDYDQLDFDTSTYSLAEWYASPIDMAHALAWIHRHTAPDMAAHPMRAILAVETKLPYDKEIWTYVGFKGGSEEQLIAGNWLMQHANGKWYTFHVFCNSPEREVLPEEILGAIEMILPSIEAELTTSD